MASLKLCPKCHTWNDNKDYCEKCDHLLNHEIARKIEVEKQEAKEANRELDAVDLFLHKVKNSRFIIVRGFYYFFYSIWFLFTAIVSLGVAIVAAGPG
jgi:hypothetical protein